VSLVVSALSLLLWSHLEVFGPLAAGVLAFLGYRGVRSSKGSLRGPGLARIAMSLALVLLVLHAWIRVETSYRRAGMRRVQEACTAVEENLRSGTPEGAYDLLSPAARAKTDRAGFVSGQRDALRALGALKAPTVMRWEGGDWERFPDLDAGESVDLRLPITIEAEFDRGGGRVEIEVLVRRRGREVEGGLEVLRLKPASR
jgi:hypothetical protein